MTEKKQVISNFPNQWIQHAERCWTAEQENADRLNDRKRQILTASAALFGLGLFSVQWFRDPKHVSNIRWDAAAISIRVCLSLSLLFFGLSLARMMLRPTRKGEKGSVSTASHSLEIPPEDIAVLGTISSAEAEVQIFSLMYRAYLDLKKRNASTALRLERAQAWFVYGIALVFLAVFTYICSSYPPIYG